MSFTRSGGGRLGPNSAHSNIVSIMRQSETFIDHEIAERGGEARERCLPG